MPMQYVNMRIWRPGTRHLLWGKHGKHGKLEQRCSLPPGLGHETLIPALVLMDDEISTDLAMEPVQWLPMSQVGTGRKTYSQ